MSDISLMGSGYYSYWFSTKDIVSAPCICGSVVKTSDVNKDDWGDYYIQCDNCEDYIQIWSGIDDE